MARRVTPTSGWQSGCGPFSARRHSGGREGVRSIYLKIPSRYSRVFNDRTQTYKAFRFDHVFPDQSIQADVYAQADIPALIERVA